MAAKTTYTMKISNPERPDSGPIEIVCTKDEDKLAKIFAKLSTYVTKELNKLKRQSPEHDSFVLAWWGDWTLTYTNSGELKTAQENDTASRLCFMADDNKFELARNKDDNKNTCHFGIETFSWNELTPDGREAVKQLNRRILNSKLERAQGAAVPATGSKPARSRHVKAAMKKWEANDAKGKRWWETEDIPQTLKVGEGTALKPSSTAAAMGHVIETEY